MTLAKKPSPTCCANGRAALDNGRRPTPHATIIPMRLKGYGQAEVSTTSRRGPRESLSPRDANMPGVQAQRATSPCFPPCPCVPALCTSGSGELHPLLAARRMPPPGFIGGAASAAGGAKNAAARTRLRSCIRCWRREGSRRPHPSEELHPLLATRRMPPPVPIH